MGEKAKTEISKRLVFDPFSALQLVAQVYAHFEVLWIPKTQQMLKIKFWICLS
jgi:hypothetical protein